ncbi:MAG: dehydrogenase [Gemmatimonadales bacterium]|nr:MAG: dehydrogenase [Gemmatimonadales bacterium]
MSSPLPAADRTHSRQFWVEEPGVGRIRSVPLPPPAPGQVTVRTLYSAVSRGSETLVFRGEVPPSQHRIMRAPFQEGEFPGPVCYGYQNVGVVEAVHEGADPSLAGTTVFSLSPHRDRFHIAASAVHPLPEGLPPRRATLAANAETALNALWDGSPGPADSIVVVGGGVVGLLVARFCGGIPGTTVQVVDPHGARRAAVHELGCTWSAGLPGALEAAADLVFHASGHPDGLRTALRAAGPDATVVELSWYGSGDVAVPLGGGFHHRRLRIRSSQVGSVPPERAPRWSRERRMGAALRLLAADPVLDVLLEKPCSLEVLPSVMARLARPGPGPLAQLVDHDAGG